MWNLPFTVKFIRWIICWENAKCSTKPLMRYGEDWNDMKYVFYEKIREIVIENLSSVSNVWNIFLKRL